MNNISGSAAGWTGITEVVEQKLLPVTRTQKEPLDLSEEIRELKQIQKRIMDKYKTNSNKNVYDAIILLEATNKSLLN